MPRRKKVLYSKPIHLFIEKDNKLSTRSKHLLINTFWYLFQLRADNATRLLSESFNNAGIDVSFPKRSAHSIYKASNKLNSVTRLSNQDQVTLTVCGNSIVEKDSASDKSFVKIRVSVQVDTLLFPPWYKRNQSFIKLLGRFISAGRKFEEESYGLLMSAIQQTSPQSEKKLIQPTLTFFKKQFGRPDLEHVPKANPLKARLLIINNNSVDNDGEPLLASVYLLIQPNQSIKYIPFKLDSHNKTHSIHEFISFPESKFSVYATKKENQISIELTLSAKLRITYRASIEEQNGTKNPFTGTRSFSHSVLWNSKHPDGKYSIIEDEKLSDCVIPFSAPNGGHDKASIEQALTKIHATLSLKEFYGDKEPKMFVEREGAHKIKPLLLG